VLAVPWDEEWSPVTEDGWDATFERLLRETIPALGDRAIEPTTRLYSVGLDSVGTMRLLMRIADAYQANIPDEALMGDMFTTPGHLWAVIQRHRTR
jgi:acyl carrier protein